MSRMSLILLAVALHQTALSAQSDSPREAVITRVALIQRADYEADRPALKRLFEELTPFVDAPGLSARVRYWRGFALWRRAINGLYGSPANDPREFEPDLLQAVDEFEKAVTNDPAFVDAKVGAASCLGYVMFINQKDAARLQELTPRTLALLKEAQAAAPENPRLLWVRGPTEWYLGPTRGGGELVALATYEKGLELARKQKGSIADPLEPSWGEPELLMNLAWSNLNRTTPDVKAAEAYALEALKIVPYWRFVRDILLPQIQKAKG